MCRASLYLGILLACSGLPSLALGQGGSALRIPSVSVLGDVGYFTYKSKLANSNDTGINYTYGFQIFGGSDKTIGASMRSTLLNATFALNNNKISEKTQTFIFNYRLGFMYAGAAFGTTQLAFTESGTEAMDCYGNTIGGNLGGVLPFGRGNAVQIDITGLKPMNIKDTQQRNVALGLKLDADMMLSFALTRRAVDLMLGFKYSQQSATVDNNGGVEKLTVPKMGLRIGANL
ncbi:MAG: hypothetical protein RJB13_690 [Pseudomonadota bacterium]|jgi:hypothetical protein